MDDLDFAILREMYREGGMTMQGLDPRSSAEAIARKLQVGRTTVQARLQAWRKHGFLLGHHVLPNPRLFGASTALQSLRIDDPRTKPRVLESLGLVDGVIAVFDSVGPWVAVSYAVESDSALARRVKLVEHLPGVSATEPPVRKIIPQATIEPSPLDWRIVAALRRRPTAPLKEIAVNVGISVKTIVRRHQALVRANAIWFQPDLDFAKFGGVLAHIILTFDALASRTVLLGALRARFSRLMEVGNPPDLPQGVATHYAEALVHFDAVGQVEEATRFALSLSGVRDVEVLHPLRIHVVESWFDERIAERVKATTRERGGRTAGTAP